MAARPDIDVIIGVRGPLAPPDFCGGLQLPIVACDHLYSFDRESLVKAIPRPEKVPAKEFAGASEELLDRLMLMADNAGATDEHRALNYLTVRCQRIYELAADALGRGLSLTAVDVLNSGLSSLRKVLDVVFSYTHRSTGVVEKHFVRVDVTDEFPFLMKPLSPYYDR